MKKLTTLLLSLTLIIGCQQETKETPQESENESSNNELIGTWAFHEWSSTSEDTSWHRTDLYGQAIFTNSYYSVIYINQDGLRDNLLADKTRDNLTVNDLLSTIGMVAANSGSYEIIGDSIAFYRNVDLYPAAMLKENQPMMLDLGNIEDDLWIREGNNRKIIWKRLE